MIFEKDKNKAFKTVYVDIGIFGYWSGYFRYDMDTELNNFK